MMIMMTIINFIDDYDENHQLYNMKMMIMMNIINFIL